LEKDEPVIWALIPAFNEETALLSLLEKIKQGLEGYEYKIGVSIKPHCF